MKGGLNLWWQLTQQITALVTSHHDDNYMTSNKTQVFLDAGPFNLRVALSTTLHQQSSCKINCLAKVWDKNFVETLLGFYAIRVSTAVFAATSECIKENYHSGQRPVKSS